MTSKRALKSLDLANGCVEMLHGAGGRAMAQLIDELFIQHFDNEFLSQRNDQACFSLPEGRVVMSTDSYVITPLFFPGGNIGDLAVNGTINDVAMSGARPLYLSAGFILEEGFPLKQLEEIVITMGQAARKAGVMIVTGDTKVVEKGKADGVFINTTGVGVVEDSRLMISADRVEPGDKILVSGYLGDHGIAIMAEREAFDFKSPITTDSAALHQLVAEMVAAAPEIHCLRDPTRGGLSAITHEIAQAAGCGIRLQEQSIPVREEVRSTCEFLGIDPLFIANEGKLVCFCPAHRADELLAVMKNNPLGRDAAIIGDVIVDEDQNVALETEFGSTRMVHYLMGEPLPRIC